MNQQAPPDMVLCRGGMLMISEIGSCLLHCWARCQRHDGETNGSTNRAEFKLRGLFRLYRIREVNKRVMYASTEERVGEDVPTPSNGWVFSAP